MSQSDAGSRLGPDAPRDDVSEWAAIYDKVFAALADGELAVRPKALRHRIVAALSVDPDSGESDAVARGTVPLDDKVRRCVEQIADIIRDRDLRDDIALSEIQDFLTIAGYDVPLRSYDTNDPTTHKSERARGTGRAALDGVRAGEPPTEYTGEQCIACLAPVRAGDDPKWPWRFDPSRVAPPVLLTVEHLTELARSFNKETQEYTSEMSRHAVRDFAKWLASRLIPQPEAQRMENIRKIQKLEREP